MIAEKGAWWSAVRSAHTKTANGWVWCEAALSRYRYTAIMLLPRRWSPDFSAQKPTHYSLGIMCVASKSLPQKQSKGMLGSVSCNVAQSLLTTVHSTLCT